MSNTFKVGQTLTARSICNYDCIFSAEVIKRTAKTVTIREHGEEKRCKIHQDENFYEGAEFIYPHGRYSMAATFVAGRNE